MTMATTQTITLVTTNTDERYRWRCHPVCWVHAFELIGPHGVCAVPRITGLR